MTYILAIAVEPHQILLRLFNVLGEAGSITQRFIEPEFQSLTDENAANHIQRMVMDGILSLLQKSEVVASQVLAVGMVIDHAQQLEHLNLNLEWPMYVINRQKALVYGSGDFEAASSLMTFDEDSQVIIWLQENMGFIETEADLERLAVEAETNLGVYFVPALNGLSLPFDDPGAKGLFIGLTRGSKRAHLVRAVQEAIVFQAKAVLEALNLGNAGFDTLKVTGASWLNPFICQTLADVCQMPVEWLQDEALGLKGAAYHAGLSAGLWKTSETLVSFIPKSRVYQPKSDLSTSYAKWCEAVERAKSDFVTVKN